MAEEFKQWSLGMTRPQTPVLPKRQFKELPDRNYSLYGHRPGKYLQHENQTFGINLGWTDDATNATGEKVARWFFVRNGGSDEPVKYGEVIAIGNGNDPSFIRHDHRDVGIDLEYSKTPVFEWVLAGGPEGTDVYTHDRIAIYNLKASENSLPLIYFDRSAGGDIGWPDSKTWTDQAKAEAWESVKDKGPSFLAFLAAA
jgi:hypothetical protein